MKKRVLFVCMGNICRSPAAEGVFKACVEKAGLERRIGVASAGTIGMHAGELPDERMRAAAKRRGYDLTSRARKFQAGDFDDFDLIITMDEQNRRDVLRLAAGPEQQAKVVPFCSFVTHHSEKEVPDPYYGGPEGFEKVLDLLEDGAVGLLKQIGVQGG